MSRLAHNEVSGFGDRYPGCKWEHWEDFRDDFQENGWINAKVIDHAETNAKEAFATLRKVANAKSVQDVIKAQGDFVKEQSARSAAHVREVGELIASFGRQALETMRGK